MWCRFLKAQSSIFSSTRCHVGGEMLLSAEPTTNLTLPENVSHFSLELHTSAHVAAHRLLLCKTARRRWPALESTSARTHQEGAPLQRPSCDRRQALLLSSHLLLHDTLPPLTVPILVAEGPQNRSNTTCRQCFLL